MPKLFEPSSHKLGVMIAAAEAKFRASRKRALAERAERARRVNRQVMQVDREQYLNQMPRARGYRT